MKPTVKGIERGLRSQLHHRSEKCPSCDGSGHAIDQLQVASFLRTSRKRAGIGLREMAGYLEISAGYLHDLEHGRRKWMPRLIERYQAALKPIRP